MTTTIFLVGATAEEHGLVAQIAPDADLVAIDGEDPATGSRSPDLAVLFAGRSVGRVNEMLATLAFDDIIPTLLVVDGELADQIDQVDLPVTDLVRRPIQKRLLKTRIETQLSLSRALKDVEAISAIGQSAAVTDRRVFDTILQYEIRRKRRYGGSLGMVALAVNNAAKDISLISNGLRDVDTVAPLSGDTAAALLPETSVAGAAIVAERLKALIGAKACVVGVLNEGESATDFLGRVTTAAKRGDLEELVILDAADDGNGAENVDWSKLD
ncbi:MAG: hypothetical protein NXI16_10495 [Alphaproteobacteria bacterium]|nr:hypothetical protein [Alphaproteobacteria bacterium]